jgi:hypothetical protein
LIVHTWRSGHFCLMQFFPKRKVILVHDGLMSHVKYWVNHGRYVLWKTGLQSTDNHQKPKCLKRNEKTLMADRDDTWTMQFAEQTERLQMDTNNCGPIACLIYRHLISRGTGDEVKHPAEINKKEWRPLVRSIYNSLIQEFKHELQVRKRRRVAQVTENNEMRHGETEADVISKQDIGDDTSQAIEKDDEGGSDISENESSSSSDDDDNVEGWEGPLPITAVWTKSDMHHEILSSWSNTGNHGTSSEGWVTYSPTEWRLPDNLTFTDVFDTENLKKAPYLYVGCRQRRFCPYLFALGRCKKMGSCEYTHCDIRSLPVDMQAKLSLYFARSYNTNNSVVTSESTPLTGVARAGGVIMREGEEKNTGENEKSEYGGICVLCQDDLYSKDILLARPLACKHQYHFDCLWALMIYDKTNKIVECPICKFCVHKERASMLLQDGWDSTDEIDKIRHQQYLKGTESAKLPVGTESAQLPVEILSSDEEDESGDDVRSAIDRIMSPPLAMRVVDDDNGNGGNVGAFVRNENGVLVPANGAIPAVDRPNPEDEENDDDYQSTDGQQPTEQIEEAVSDDDHSGTGDGNHLRHEGRRFHTNRRRLSQSVNASQMIRRHNSTIVPAKRGDMVCIYSKDRRDGGHGPKTLGVEGVVYNNPSPPGYGIHVVTLYGIVVASGRTPRWLTSEWYHVTDVTAAQGGLGPLRLSILNNTFNESTKRALTMTAAIKMRYGYGVTTVDKCGCSRLGVNPCRTNQCGCKKNGQKCSHRCGCGENCRNGPT